MNLFGLLLFFEATLSSQWFLPHLAGEGDPPNPGFPLLPGVSTQVTSGGIGTATSTAVVRVANQTGQVKIVAAGTCGPKEVRTNPAGLAHCAATN